MVNKDLFKYGEKYTLDQMVEIAGEAGLDITDCLEDSYPHYTVDFEEQPVFQFHPVSDEHLVLSWTDWDDEPTPDTAAWEEAMTNGLRKFK